MKRKNERGYHGATVVFTIARPAKHMQRDNGYAHEQRDVVRGGATERVRLDLPSQPLSESEGGVGGWGVALRVGQCVADKGGGVGPRSVGESGAVGNGNEETNDAADS